MKKLLAVLVTFVFPGFLIAQPKPLAFTHATVIDMVTSTPKRDMTVVIQGDRITAIGKSSKLRSPKGAIVIDATGKFLIPGLWDMHVHALEPNRVDFLFPLFIANGVTGIRDVGTTEAGFASLDVLRRDISAGVRVGPTIAAAGRILDGFKPSVPRNSIPFTTEAEARQAVQFLKRSGADFVKVYDGIPKDQYYAIIDEAKKLNIAVAGHVPAEITSAEASDAGQRSFEHLANILEGCSTLDHKVIEDRALAVGKPSGKPGDFSHIPARIAERIRIQLETYDEKKCQSLFAKLAKNETWQVPTLIIKKPLSLIEDGTFFDDPRMKYIRRAELEDWKPENQMFLKFRTPEFKVQKRRLYYKELELTAALHKAGVPIMSGTDAPGAYIYPGFSLHDELQLFVENGFTPYDALKTATRNPAEYLNLLDKLGTVEKGKVADLVLLDANPLLDISNTRKIFALVAKGRYFDRTSLNKLLSDEAEAAATGKVELTRRTIVIPYGDHSR